ncbi:MAG: HDOD domain-containing protein [Planctomycetota bacterium]|nr:HDOD domain-containing protein [Planctomycetota bacterium]
MTRAATLLNQEAERLHLMTKVQDGLEDLSVLRPFPAAVTQLLAACQDPKSTAATYEKIIEIDPGLSMRLLRMTNSPLYGFTKEIRNVGQAASLLGVRKLRSLALSVAGMQVFTAGTDTVKGRQALWSHSIACATLAGVISEHCRVDGEEQEFLAGIFHDVGMLFLYDIVPEAYVKLVDCVSDANLPDGERFLFGTTHEEIGMRSANGWGLSEEIKTTIGFHHRPEEAPAHRSLVSLIFAADALDHAWGVSTQMRPQTPVSLGGYLLDFLGLDEAGLAQLEEASHQTFLETRRVLGA